jgi:hypothetical protein
MIAMNVRHDLSLQAQYPVDGATSFALPCDTIEHIEVRIVSDLITENTTRDLSRKCREVVRFAAGRSVAFLDSKEPFGILAL